MRFDVVEEAAVPVFFEHAFFEVAEVGDFRPACVADYEV